jgi:lactobin A/cerein 7B family class IIb bacteriocin
MEVKEDDMRELNEQEVQQVSGGLAPLVFGIIATDLMLNTAVIAYATFMYMTREE